MIIWTVWQKLKCHLEISTGSPLASLSDSRSQQPISFLVQHFRSSWGFCLALRMITWSRDFPATSDVDTAHTCDPWYWACVHAQEKHILCNGSQLMNPDISSAIFTLSLSILILNSQCVEGARYVRVRWLTPIKSRMLHPSAKSRPFSL